MALSASPPSLHCWREGFYGASLSLSHTLLGAPSPTGSHPDALVWPSRPLRTRPQLTSYLLSRCSLLSVRPWASTISLLPDSSPLLVLFSQLTPLLQLHHLQFSFSFEIQLHGWPWA